MGKHLRIIRMNKKEREGYWVENHGDMYWGYPTPRYAWHIYYVDGSKNNPRETVYADDEIGAMAAFYRLMGATEK